MPTYQIAGISIFIPDLNEITQSIIGPIESFIGALQQQIVAAITSSLSFLSSLGQQVGSYLQNSLLPAIQNFFAPLQTAFQAAYSTIAALPGQILAAIQSAGSLANAAINQVRMDLVSLLQTYVVTPLTQAQNFIVSTLTNAANTIRQDFASAKAYLDQRILELQQNVAAANQFTANAVNQLFTNFQSFGASFSAGFAAIGKDILDSIQQFYNGTISPFLQNVGTQLSNMVNSVSQQAFQLVTGKLSNDPQTAVREFLSRIAVITDGVIGGFAAFKIIENIHPFHSLHISETFKHILEFVGVYDLSRETLKLFVDNGIGLQAEYFVNYFYQVRKIDIGTAQKAVWYQNKSVDQFRQDVRYEGLEDPAIEDHVATLYKPMPAFILARLIELGVTDDQFNQKQLLREGFDPQDLPSLIKGFQNLNLVSFQNNAKSQIFQLYKDGFVNITQAQNIMTAFNVPKNQQDWILYLATQQYQFEQQVKLKDLAIAELQKGAIDPGEAMQELLFIGMDAKRAAIEIRLAGVKGAPTLGKADRFALAQEVLSIPVGI